MGIEEYKYLKNSYTNENNRLTMIDTSLEENTQGSEMTTIVYTRFIKYDKSNKYFDSSDKTLWI